jgi:hypothetical protein
MVKINVVPVAFIGVAAVAAAIGVLVRRRNRVDRSYDRSNHVKGRTSSSGVGSRRTRLLAGASVMLACWSTWRASGLALERSLSTDLAQPM